VDDSGEPIANANVSVGQWDAPSGMSMGMPRLTDDRGMFRVFGLRPGQYRICADPRQFVGPAEEGQDRLIRTCYPSAFGDGDAQPIVVSSADVGPIDIRLQRNRAYKITGMAIDSSGAPIANPNVNLVPVAPFSTSTNANTQVKDGRFTFTGVTPGEYGIQVSFGNSRFFNPDDKRDPEMGYTTVRVDAADVDGVVVTTSKGAKVAGRIVFEGAAPDLGTSKLSIMARADDLLGRGRMFMLGPQSPATVRDDMSFELDRLFGPQLLMVMGAPRGWIVKSVKYRGDDVTDAAVEFKSGTDPRLLEVTLTNQVAIVTGRVLGDDGKPSPDAYVLMLPTDLTRWRPVPGSPLITPKSDGTFTIGPVRAGEYIVAAAIGISTQKLLDPAVRADIAERLAKAGERIVLVENDKRSVDVRITKLQ
jgi:protocatechuate 3,4-dioxygenase beta subunit